MLIIIVYILFYYVLIPTSVLFFGFGIYDLVYTKILFANDSVTNLIAIIILLSLLSVYSFYRLSFFFKKKNKVININSKIITYLNFIFFIVAIIYIINGFNNLRYMPFKEFNFFYHLLNVVQFLFNCFILLLIITKKIFKITLLDWFLIITTSALYINGINSALTTILIIFIFNYYILKKNNNFYKTIFLFLASIGLILFILFSSLQIKSYLNISVKEYFLSLKQYSTIHYVNQRFFINYATLRYNLQVNSNIYYLDTINLANYRINKLYSKIVKKNYEEKKIIYSIEYKNASNIYNLNNQSSQQGTTPGLIGVSFISNNVAHSLLFLFVSLFFIVIGVEKILYNYKINNNQIVTQYFIYKFLLSVIMSNYLSFLYILDETLVYFIFFLILFFFRIKFK